MPFNLQVAVLYLINWAKNLSPTKTVSPVSTNDATVPETDTVRHVTGHNVTFYVPGDMGRIKVRLQNENGTTKAEYVLTNYMDIQPGERIQILVMQ